MPTRTGGQRCILCHEFKDVVVALYSGSLLKLASFLGSLIQMASFCGSLSNVAVFVGYFVS